MTRQTKADRDKADRRMAAIALSLQFRGRRGKRAYEVFSAAEDACKGITVSHLLDGDVTEAKMWARASVLLDERLRRVLR